MFYIYFVRENIYKVSLSETFELAASLRNKRHTKAFIRSVTQYVQYYTPRYSLKLLGKICYIILFFLKEINFVPDFSIVRGLRWRVLLTFRSWKLSKNERGESHTFVIQSTGARCYCRFIQCDFDSCIESALLWNVIVSRIICTFSLQLSSFRRTLLTKEMDILYFLSWYRDKANILSFRFHYANIDILSLLISTQFSIVIHLWGSKKLVEIFSYSFRCISLCTCGMKRYCRFIFHYFHTFILWTIKFDSYWNLLYFWCKMNSS